ncbi:MAG: protein kinase [Planctomycetaceae bacterium]
MSTANTVAYRCVCGATMQVDTNSGGTCQECNRAYTANAVNGSMSMTVGMPTDVAIEPVEPEDDEMLGRSLNHFTIVDRLGGGGMGTVYRALDESLQRYVAIKVIRRDRAVSGTGDTFQLERLLQEARAQARVNHANVVHIYFVSRDEEMPYLAMELVTGESLAQRLQKPMPYSEVTRIAGQIADALREAAQFDIVHGDIKPANILMNEGNAKLSDFGLAQRMSRQTEDDAKVAGTPNYMAPEVCRGELADTRSDQYSFGVMLFEMTFGTLPYSFADSTLETRFTAHQFAPIEFPMPWPATVPEVWREVLQRLLAKNPEDRYSSYEELLADLARCRPIAPVPAGRLVRGIAWGIDLIILCLIQTVTLALAAFGGEFIGVPAVLRPIPGLIVPITALLWQRAGGRSPGKRLMQIRVVDEHGLPPSPRVLAWRSVFQLLPAWALPITADINGAGLPGWITLPIGLMVAVALFADAVIAVVTRGMRSIHDRIFKTRVVLDSPE